MRHLQEEITFTCASHFKKKCSKGFHPNQGPGKEPGNATCSAALEKSCRGTLLQKPHFCPEPSGHLQKILLLVSF